MHLKKSETSRRIWKMGGWMLARIEVPNQGKINLNRSVSLPDTKSSDTSEFPQVPTRKARYWTRYRCQCRAMVFFGLPCILLLTLPCRGNKQGCRAVPYAKFGLPPSSVQDIAPQCWNATIKNMGICFVLEVLSF